MNSHVGENNYKVLLVIFRIKSQPYIHLSHTYKSAPFKKMHLHKGAPFKKMHPHKGAPFKNMHLHKGAPFKKMHSCKSEPMRRHTLATQSDSFNGNPYSIFHTLTVTFEVNVWLALIKNCNLTERSVIRQNVLINYRNSLLIMFCSLYTGNQDRAKLFKMCNSNK